MDPPVTAYLCVALYGEGLLVPDCNGRVTMVLDIAGGGQSVIEGFKHLVPVGAGVCVKMGVVNPEVEVRVRVHGLLIVWIQVVVEDVCCGAAGQHTCGASS